MNLLCLLNPFKKYTDSYLSACLFLFFLVLIVPQQNAFAQNTGGPTVKVKKGTGKTDKQALKKSTSTKPVESREQAPRNGNGTVKARDGGKKTSQSINKGSGGDVKPSDSRQQAPRNGDGTVKARDGGKRTSQAINKGSSGDLKPTESRQQAPRNTAGTTVIVNDKKDRKLNKQMAKYQGDLSQPESRMKPPKYDNYVVVNHKKERKLTKQMAKYQGDIVPGESRMQGPRNSDGLVEVREIDRKQGKQIANYKGDLANNFLEKRTAMRIEKSRQMANYKGDLLVRSLNQKARKIRKKQKDIANYQGDIVVRSKKKGMHPSSVYRGGKVKNSYQAKERYRKRMLKKYGRNSGIEDANYMKKKDRKPRHDKKESEIWY